MVTVRPGGREPQEGEQTPPQRAQADLEQEGTQVEAHAFSFGALLRLLSELERRGHDAEVGALRDRLRAAVRERPLEEVHTEMAAVRRAADALERRA